MILRRLQDTSNMTEIEKGIAQYILVNYDKVIKMTAKELAEATYTSQSSVLRLCNKIDEKGFSDFKMRLSVEMSDMRKKKLDIDTNHPFSKEDSIDEIARKIEDVSTLSIMETRENLNPVNIKRIVKRIRECKVIDIYGIGGSQSIAMDFKERMVRIGKVVRLEAEVSYQFYQAMNSNKDHFAIIISHSGTTRDVIRIARILKKQKVSALGITSEGENELMSLVDYSIQTATAEQKILMYKLDNIASQTAVKYVLDVLYACIYEEDYEKYREITMKNELRLKELELR